MPDVTIGTGEVSSGRVTLVANQVTTITFAENIAALEITSDGAAAAYYTIDGSTPTMDGKNTYELPASVLSVDERVSHRHLDMVKLISDGTPTIRVSRKS